MAPKELACILDFAVESAHLAGRLTLGHFNAGTAHERKADDSPVTVADRAAEKLLRERIERTWPAHGIIGEEYGEQPGREPGRWILDPIDGTQSFICGVPLYCVLIGFEWRGEIVAGVVHMPALEETVYAARGLGCRWNGRPARVSEVSSLADARMTITDLAGPYRHGRAAAYERLRDACGVVRGWSDGYAFALLATGRVDIVLEPVMNLWDNAALLPIITEAGGTFTDWAGTPTHTASEALATNGRLLTAALAALRD